MDGRTSMNTIIRSAGALMAGLLATVAFTGSAQAATTKVQITAKVGSQEFALNSVSTGMAVPRPRIPGATFQTWIKRDVGNFATYESVDFPGRCRDRRAAGTAAAQGPPGTTVSAAISQPEYAVVSVFVQRGTAAGTPGPLLGPAGLPGRDDHGRELPVSCRRSMSIENNNSAAVISSASDSGRSTRGCGFASSRVRRSPLCDTRTEPMTTEA